MNLIFAGTGTMLSSILGDSNINKTQLLVGLFQLLTAIALVGYIWSAYWAYLLIIESQGDHSEMKNLLGMGSNNSAANPTNGQAKAGQNV